jgi:hypothetical protein
MIVGNTQDRQKLIHFNQTNKLPQQNMCKSNLKPQANKKSLS